MNQLSYRLKKAIAYEASQCAPEECCGFIVDGEIMPCKNAHNSPETNFAIAAEDYARAEEKGKIEAIYHSHIGGIDAFSMHDLKACKQCNVPWVMIHIPSNNFHYIDPTGNAPYEGREWTYGLHDCYALLRDFYAREFNIQLDDFERKHDEEWLNPEWSMFMENYESQGFYEVGRPGKKGDMLLMRMQSPQPNHVGVMNGNGACFYHHLSNRLSQSSVYGGYWAKVTVKVLRHKDV
jgi:proteasome lid subunit RPN8/RPN11